MFVAPEVVVVLLLWIMMTEILLALTIIVVVVVVVIGRLVLLPVGCSSCTLVGKIARLYIDRYLSNTRLAILSIIIHYVVNS